jgi:putative transposase
MISFKGRHYPKEVILMSVRWYIAYALSYRNIEEMLLERGISIDHATLNRWVITYAPLLEEAFRKRHKKVVGRSWRMDETYVKLKGKWVYYYRAVDKEGNTVDFYLSSRRDISAARGFFEKAIGHADMPDKVTIDKSGANLAALKSINKRLSIWCFLMASFKFFILSFIQIQIRQIKYLNNIIEQDHRSIKKITKPMMGFKSFDSAESTLAGIELHHMLRKQQHKQAGNQTIFEQFYALAG